MKSKLKKSDRIQNFGEAYILFYSNILKIFNAYFVLFSIQRS